MGTDNSIRNITKSAFYILLAVILIGFFWAQNYYPSETEPESRRENLKFEGTLIWEKPDGSKEEITAPGKYEVLPGQDMVISTMLPPDYKESYIEIRGSLQNVRFFIDGKLRSEYDTKDSRPFGSDSVSRYIFCKTSMEDAGKELRIELTSNSERYSGVVNEILCGDKTDIWAYIYSMYGTETLIAFIILFAGIITVLLSVALSIAYKTRIYLIYLGWCMVLGAVWMIGESKLRQLMVPNASALASLCFVALMLCPVPLLLYVDGVQQGRYRKLFSLIECAALLNLLVSSILQFSERADYLETLFWAQVIMGCACVCVMITFFLDYRIGRIRDYYLIVVGLMIAMMTAVMESISVYFVISLSGIFLGAGLLILLVFTIIMTVKDIRDLESKRQKDQLENRRKQTEIMTLQMIQAMSTMIEAKDEYTSGHSHRVAEYSGLIAKELGWNEKDAENIKNAAYLHDIGKIGIPDTILNKPTKLLDAEYEIIKKHPVMGSDILKNITLIEHADDVARYHHERYDGHGYPEGLAGEEIPIQARIVSIADSYDAMNSRRIYRKALSEHVIRKEISENRGRQFDPVVTDAFLRLMDEKRLQISEEPKTIFAEGTLSELETDSTIEAGRILSDIVSAMEKQKDADGMDYLTGLPMRNIGEKKIAQMIQDNGGCLVFMDMDNLKKINDIYGHRAGDRALRILGNTISDHMEDSLACRLGGDEFLIFLSDVTKESASEMMKQIFESFYRKKEEDLEIRDASLSGGLCMCLKGDSFAECYAKADKALYYVKQNGKNNFSFYHQLQQGHDDFMGVGTDLKQVAKAIHQSGYYTGALDLDNREFSKIYEYISNLGERYKHSCHLVMITMDAISGNTTFIEEIEEALKHMEMAIRMNIRNADVCTRYSAMQYLIILVEAGEENIPVIIERIVSQYYRACGESGFRPRYEYIPMLAGEMD